MEKLDVPNSDGENLGKGVAIFDEVTYKRYRWTCISAVQPHAALVEIEVF